MKFLMTLALMLVVAFICFLLIWFGNMTARIIFG
jgi:hypothetical protein